MLLCPLCRADHRRGRTRVTRERSGGRSAAAARAESRVGPAAIGSASTAPLGTAARAARRVADRRQVRDRREDAARVARQLLACALRRTGAGSPALAAAAEPAVRCSLDRVGADLWRLGAARPRRLGAARPWRLGAARPWRPPTRVDSASRRVRSRERPSRHPDAPCGVTLGVALGGARCSAAQQSRPRPRRSGRGRPQAARGATALPRAPSTEEIGAGMSAAAATTITKATA